MKNDFFNIIIDPITGAVTGIFDPSDTHNMNWCLDKGQWGSIHCGFIQRACHSSIEETIPRYELTIMKPVSVSEFCTVYENSDIRMTVERSFVADRYVERYTMKNLRDSDLFVERGDIGIILPFNDVYTYAEDCLINHCHTHIWCGENTAYINALRMGNTGSNLGLVLTEGSIKSYSTFNTYTNNRGQFMLNLDHVELLSGEEYSFEWQLFWHSGYEDFIKKASQFDTFVNISTKYFTVFENEDIEFTVYAARDFEVFCDGQLIEHDGSKVHYHPSRLGEHRFEIIMGRHRTYAEFFVAESLDTIIKKRVKFIVRNQQYHRDGSPLDGAFLIYDLKEKHLVFDSVFRDHNACRERTGVVLLILKYLQSHEDNEVREALERYIKFMFREYVDAETGEVFDGVQKNAKYKRLYNAPWITTLLTELYLLTSDKKYLTYVLRILRHYYASGGSHFYPNGLSMRKTVNAFKDAGMEQECAEVLEMFTVHVNNIVANGCAYPKHEVNFEQTIVSPAATFTSELASITGEAKYRISARDHIELLERFNGHQPSFHMNETPIRFWDDYWFGKQRRFGDNFPHYWSCLTGRSMAAYSRCSGDTYYLEAAERCLRNCLCLFNEKGEGHAAYVYPFKVNGADGAFYDGWANDQDFALYFYLESLY